MSLFKKDPLQIIPFKTYGTLDKLYLQGRALEDEDIDLEHKSWFQILLNSWKRFETDEIRHADVIITLDNGVEISATTDAEGYYLISTPESSIDTLVDSGEWLNYTVSYRSYTGKRVIQKDNRFMGKMLVPSNKAVFGVVSDIDDTILHTGVTSRLKWRVVVNTLFTTPAKRKALEGSADFYHRLHDGVHKDKQNPIFYVSNSPWNLYRYLEFFLKQNKFPDGPILLRDFRTPFDKTVKPEIAHKYNEIYTIFESYPDLKFILIGDCGEKDAYIYLDIVKKYPERVLAIYLRSVNHESKMKRIHTLFEDYKDVPVLIVHSSEEAIEHARELSLID